MTRDTVSIGSNIKSKIIGYKAPIVGLNDLIGLVKEINPEISNYCEVQNAFSSGDLCYLGFFIPGDYRDINYLTEKGKTVKGKFMIS